MNLAAINDDLRKALVSREKCIAFIVHLGEFYWLIDFPDHFTLDQQKNINALCAEERYRQFLPVGLTIQQWKEKLQNEFRGGIPTLAADQFVKYRNSELVAVVKTDILRREFFFEDSGQYESLSSAMEGELSFNTPMTEALVELRCRLFSKLPKFYINYDRKIFMHMVRGRFFENALIDGWWGAEGDFEHMIPTSHRYWTRAPTEDFWAVTNFSNYE